MIIVILYTYNALYMIHIIYDCPSKNQSSSHLQICYFRGHNFIQERNKELKFTWFVEKISFDHC